MAEGSRKRNPTLDNTFHASNLDNCEGGVTVTNIIHIFRDQIQFIIKNSSVLTRTTLARFEHLIIAPRGGEKKKYLINNA